MGLNEIDFNLTKEAKDMRDLAQEFGMEVLRPAGIKLDKIPPEGVIAEGSQFWDVMKKYRELGFHKMMLPKEVGGMMEDLPPKAALLVNEQLGYADVGLTASLGVATLPFAMAMLSTEPEIRIVAREYAEDTKGQLIGCWCLTEPDHGSDWILLPTLEGTNPKVRPSVHAHLEGDEYILNGTKAAWTSNGSIATHTVIHAGLDGGRGMQGSGLFFCPLHLPGVSRGKPLDKLGQRPLNQAEIIFEEVRLPKRYALMEDSDPSAIVNFMKMFLSTANGGMSALFGGLAGAAFDEALHYAKERIQGGVPLAEHKNIKIKLFNMFKVVESVRLFARQAAESDVLKYAVAAKIHCTEAAFQVANEALQIFGGSGLAKEYTIEKIFRDARVSMIEDGVNETLALAMADDL